MKYHYVIHKYDKTKDVQNQPVDSQDDDEEEKGDQPVDGDENDQEDNNQKQFQVYIPNPWEFDAETQYDWLPLSEFKKRGVKELTVSCMMARK